MRPLFSTILIILAINLISCSITKRKFRKGYYIQNKSSVDKTTINDTFSIENKKTKIQDTMNFDSSEKKPTKTNESTSSKSNIKSQDPYSFYYSLNTGIAYPIGVPISFEFYNNGIGLFIDYYGISTVKYNSIGINYDFLKKIQSHSLKAGITIQLNYKFNYEYLFKYKNQNLFIGTQFLLVTPQHITDIKEDPDYNKKAIPDEKYLSKNGWFITPTITFGIKFKY